MNDAIRKIAELTANLPAEIPDLVSFETPIGGAVVHIGSPGKLTHTSLPTIGLGLHRDADFAVMRLFTPKGGLVDTHQHDTSFIWIGVITGELEIIYPVLGTTDTLKPNDALRIKPGTPHALHAIEDTLTWAVSLPPAAGFPDVTVCPFGGQACINDDNVKGQVSSVDAA